MQEQPIPDQFDIATPPTRAGAVEALRRAFDTSRLPTPALDARLLVAEAAGLRPVELLTAPDDVLSDEQWVRAAAFARRRLLREPTARILGWAEFWSLPFRLSAETLVPRPDTETLVEAVLERVPDRSAGLSVLDLGTGSGCLLVALLSELPRAVGIGVDRAPGALATARLNARINGVELRARFVVADWASPIASEVDVVVSNPPYIATAVVDGLEDDVRRYDPALALDGGPDGLASLRRVLTDAARLLRRGGLAVVEIGYDQEEAARGLAAAAGLLVEEVRADLGGNPRALVARRP